MADSLLVQSKVKEKIKADEMRCGEDFIEALNAKVEALIDDAVSRCKENGRQTLKKQDV